MLFFDYLIIYLAPPTQIVLQLDSDWTVAKQHKHFPANQYIGLLCVGLHITAGQLLSNMYNYLYVSIYLATSEIRV